MKQGSRSLKVGPDADSTSAAADAEETVCDFRFIKDSEFLRMITLSNVQMPTAQVRQQTQRRLCVV